MRKELLEEGEYYHVYNRGVDKREIFLDNYDRLRFANSLYIFNNFLNIPFRFNINSLKPVELLTPIQPYVEIAAACIMPNHYHILLTPKIHLGISNFLHKIGVSYTKYFNNKYNRSGSLFESSFKVKHIDKHEYATYLTQYIHLNPYPLELCQTKLGTEKIENYEWSSLPDYLGGRSRLTKAISLDFRNDVLGMDSLGYRKLFQETYSSLCQA
ncbi:MAG: transposase [bacterium]|nr:transposase [bacterium]